jgi:hypothetical protein
LFISNDAIHVQVEGGGEESNAKCIGTLETNDYLCAVHDVCWCAKTCSCYVYNHNKDKEHANTIDGMGRPLV